MSGERPAAAVVGPDGQISVCYAKGKSKGKKKGKRKGKRKGRPKGAVRVVSPRKRCKRGERRLSWSAQGQPGQAGSPGASGQQGLPGPQGPIDPTLEARVAQLEAVLAGTSNADLVGAITNASKLDGISAAELAGAITEVAKLNGITATELSSAVDAVAAVESLCTEMSSVVTTLNGVHDAVANLALGGIIPPGLALVIPPLPGTLPAYSCP
ncbi:MAG: hypothetical protein ACRDL6_03365 [Solirubrobacterales bacterium]